MDGPAWASISVPLVTFGGESYGLPGGLCCPRRWARDGPFDGNRPSPVAEDLLGPWEITVSGELPAPLMCRRTLGVVLCPLAAPWTCSPCHERTDTPLSHQVHPLAWPTRRVWFHFNATEADARDVIQVLCRYVIHDENEHVGGAVPLAVYNTVVTTDDLLTAVHLSPTPRCIGGGTRHGFGTKPQYSALLESFVPAP